MNRWQTSTASWHALRTAQQLIVTLLDHVEALKGGTTPAARMVERYATVEVTRDRQYVVITFHGHDAHDVMGALKHLLSAVDISTADADEFTLKITL